MDNMTSTQFKLHSNGFREMHGMRGVYVTDREDCDLTLYFGERTWEGRPLEKIRVTAKNFAQPGGLAEEWNMCEEIKGLFPDVRVVAAGKAKYDK